MINIDLTNQDIYTDNTSLFQWDYGQSLVISGLSVTGDVQVHFARKNTDAEIRMGTYANSKITVAIPDVILQKSGMFHAYIYLTDGTSGETVKVINMNVRERERPTDYTSEPYVDVVNQLNSKLNQIIATGIANYQPDPAVVEALVTQQVNAMLANLGDMATKDQVAKLDLTTALAAEIDEKINSSKITTTLAPTQTGFIHDAKTVGDAITTINNNLGANVKIRYGSALATFVNGEYTVTIDGFSNLPLVIAQIAGNSVGVVVGVSALSTTTCIAHAKNTTDGSPFNGEYYIVYIAIGN